jgi:hypothetical protein
VRRFNFDNGDYVITSAHEPYVTGSDRYNFFNAMTLGIFEHAVGVEKDAAYQGYTGNYFNADHTPYGTTYYYGWLNPPGAVPVERTGQPYSPPNFADSDNPYVRYLPWHAPSSMGPVRDSGSSGGSPYAPIDIPKPRPAR